jgi:MFS family permease
VVDARRPGPGRVGGRCGRHRAQLALPTLSKALHASESDLQWFSSGYFLVLAAAMLPAGLLGDRYGRKKVLLVSLALFGAGSAGCAYSTTVAEFMAARVLVGLAGAGLIVMALSVLTVLFAEEERPKGCGDHVGGHLRSLPDRPLVELSEEKSGVGSGVMQAVNKTEAPLGIAVLGSVLSAGYLARLDLVGLPAATAAAARQGVFGGVAVAHKLHSPALLTSVHRAFVHGMDMAILVSVGSP